MSNRDGDPWITCFEPNPSAKLRLFCFPYAGAGASVFRTWASSLPSHIEVCGVQYPGREGRAREKAFQKLPELLEALIPAIVPHLDKPFVFFGHSMGALVSFELTRALDEVNGLRPEHVFFSGSRAPHIPEPRPIHHLPNLEFWSELVKINGIPPDVLKSSDLVEYFLPILRADFATCETYHFQLGCPLQCPVTVFGGEHDTLVDRSWLEAWRDHASVYFSLRMLPGDHFFVRSAQPTLLRAMTRELQPLMEAVGLT
jgi:medium-chain acyl-[acyl-carrier-protein] hydrolase